ncbi:MAG: hypothetical protein LC775_20430 [Acidobacteria bacterium]|nr:hypothetical protein [Acidobacteriota bacterium]
MSATGFYDIKLPPADKMPPPPQSYHVEVRREVPARGADRFQVTVGAVGDALHTGLHNLYAVDVTANVHGESAPFFLGSAVVADTEFNPTGVLGGESEGDTGCVARNKTAIRRVLSSKGNRLDQLITLRRLADLAEPDGPWPIDCGQGQAVPKKIGSLREDISGDGLPEIAITVRCTSVARREIDHIIVYVGTIRKERLSRSLLK